MITVNLPEGDNTAKVSGLWQWNYGQMLRIQGLDLPAAVEIHFSLQDIGGESITRIGTTADGVTDVVIPDSMLENEEEMGERYSIFAYIYLSDTKTGKTIKKIEMNVSTRPKPEAWDKPGDEELFHQAIEAVNAAADRAETAEGNAAESAESAKEDAVKTAEDRKKVEELVEMTADIEEQVEEVKQYKEQAATAATNAALSEQAAKAAQDAATQAQTAAENAEDAAEQHALKAAGDKVEVERMAGQVAVDKTQVAQDKADIEKQVADFELAAQQVVEDVNNAGQTQVEHVKSAGETAVKELNAAKDTAAQEIDSAKDTSVQAVNSAGQEQAAAVQAEGEKVIDSIPEDYKTAMDGKLDKQQGVENAGKALVVGEDGQITPGDYSGNANMEQLLTLAIKRESEQAEMLHITDSAEFPIVSLSGQGYTEQKTTEGTNLFDYTALLNEDEVIQSNFQNAKTISPFEVEEGKKYTLITKGRVVDNGTDCSSIYFGEDDLKYMSASTYVLAISTGGYSFKNDEEIRTVLTAKRSCVVTKCIVHGSTLATKYEIEEFGLFEGEEKENVVYEEYTGNQPSPNQDYPQEIKSEGIVSRGTQKYERTIKIAAKNMFDIDDDEKYLLESVTHTDTEITKPSTMKPFLEISGLRVGEIYTVSYNTVLVSSITAAQLLWSITSENAEYPAGKISSGTGNGGTNYSVEITFDAPAETVYLIGAIRAETITELQIEYGPQKTEYEKFREPQSIKITSDRPISKWDRLVLRDGVYGWAYNTINEEYDGTEKVNTGTALGKNARYYINSKLTKAVENVECRCNYLSNVPSWANDQTGFRLGQNNVALYMYLNKEEFPDANSVKAWLQQKKEEGTPFRAQYQSETEEFVPLPEEEQQALKELCTNYPETIISTDSGLLLQVNYVADTQTYIQNNFQPKTELESLKERVSALERAAIQ